MEDLSARHNGWRRRSAKAGNRGRLAACGGATLYGDLRTAGMVVDINGVAFAGCFAPFGGVRGVVELSQYGRTTVRQAPVAIDLPH